MGLNLFKNILEVFARMPTSAGELLLSSNVHIPGLRQQRCMAATTCIMCYFLFYVSCFKFQAPQWAYITANKLNFKVVELDSAVYLSNLWMCLKWISISVGTYPPCCFKRSRVSYSSCELKAVRTSRPRTGLPTEVWECIISLGIRKPNRSKRDGHGRKCKIRSEADLVNRGPWNVKNSNQSKEEEQGQQNIISPASIPSVIYASSRSVTGKIDELQAVVSINNPSIVCITKTLF